MIPPDARQDLIRVFDPSVDETLSMEDVRNFLIQRITHLLEFDANRLMSALYRIDVYESKVKAAFSTSAPHQLPVVLADLVIERQIQKIRIRQRYSEGSSDSSFGE